MIKKRKSYRVVAGSIRSELLRGLSRKICIGALAFSAAVKWEHMHLIRHG